MEIAITLSDLKKSILNSSTKVTEFKSATDGVNMVSKGIDINGNTVCHIYKSYTDKLKLTYIVRYTNPEL
jgi:hypothetical protein